MRIKLIALAFLLLLPVTAHAQGTSKAKGVLNTEISTSFPDNMAGAITPAIMRNTLNDLIASWQQYIAFNTQLGTSYNILGSDYGQIVSFNNANPVTAVAPQPTGSLSIFNFYVTNLGAGTVTLTATGGTINGLASFTIPTNQSYWFVSDQTGTNYRSFALAAAAAAGFNTQIQFNSGGNFGASANLTWVNPTLTIGLANTSTGILAMNGGASGTVTITPQAVAGSPTLTLPNTTGTLASTVSSPLALNTTTGQISIVGAYGGVLAGVGPPAFTTTPTLGVAGTTTGTLALTSGASGGGTITLNPISTTGTYNWNFPTGAGSSNQILQSGGGSATAMAWSTATYPATTTTNQILWSSSANSIGGLTTANNGVLGTSNTGVPSITTTPALGVAATTTGTLAIASGASGSGAITLNPIAGTGSYNWNFPTSAGSSGAPLLSGGGGVVPMTFGTLGLSFGGTNNTLTANNGGVVWSDTTKLNILAGTITANQALLSGSTATPAWSSATYPATTTINQLLWSSAANSIGGLATLNSGMLNTNASGVPSITITPTLGVAATSTGTLALSSGANATTITIAPPSAGGNATFRLPEGTGSNTQVLTTDGSGNTKWVSVAGTGTVTSVTCSGGINCSPNPIVGAGTVTADIATNANIWAGTANKVLDAGNVFNSAGGLTTLTPAAVVTPDFNTGFNFAMTLTSNVTIGNPINTKVGQTGCIMLLQDASGSRLINYYNNWHFAGTTTPALSTGAGSIDQLCYLVRSTGTTTPIMANLNKNF